VIQAHILGLPVEESVLQLLPAGTATLAILAVGVRETVDRLRRRRPGPKRPG
jgi:hypothetical protein